MAEYRYAGPHPVPGEEGELVHPGDVREYAAEPGWGPWELLGEPDVPPPADDPPDDDLPAPFPAEPDTAEGM